MAGRPIDSPAHLAVDGPAFENGAHVAIGACVQLLVAVAYEDDGLALAGGGHHRDLLPDYRRLGEAALDYARHRAPEHRQVELTGHRPAVLLFGENPWSGANRYDVARLVEGVAPGSAGPGVHDQGDPVSHWPAMRRD